jgi:hypothetical protein
MIIKNRKSIQKPSLKNEFLGSQKKVRLEKTPQLEEKNIAFLRIKGKLIRKGRVAGLVNDHFYRPELKPTIWDKLELPSMEE